MPENILFCLTGIIVLGVGTQWISWRIGVPSILLSLLAGVLVGPVGGWLDPDALFGDLLLPVASMAVALILYEGGLSLKVSELKRVGKDVFKMVSIGAFVTWGVTTFSARWVLGFDWGLSALVGAVLVVTGPTVIGPLLRVIRPSGAVGPLLKWEGIVIDPIGALLSVLIFEALLMSEAKQITVHVLGAVAKTIVIGGGLGVAAAAVLVLVLGRHWIADYLENAFSLMLCMGVFALSNGMQHESGLLAVTVMGFALANQKRVDIEHIVEFKENLKVLLISSLFIVLAARVDLQALRAVLPRGVIFVGLLILVARPLAVFFAMHHTSLSKKERLFVAWMAPRGIVAAAIASVFAIRLEQVGYANASQLLSVTFLTIMATVAIYGSTSAWLGRRLGVAEANPQGILFAGTDEWVRKLAELLKTEGFHVVMVDTNRENIRLARMAGLEVYGGSILGESALDRIDLGGLGRLLAVTANNWVNVLTVRRFERIFGRKECYQLAPGCAGDSLSEDHQHLYGRRLFGESLDFSRFSRLIRNGFVPKATLLTEAFDFAAFRDQHGAEAAPLFLISKDRRLSVVTADESIEPVPGDTLVSLVKKPDTAG